MSKTSKTSPETDTPGFEQAMAQLEALVESMEKGDLSLEDSLQAFEQGVRLTRICQQALKDAEQKVQILSKASVDADLEPYDRDD